MTKNEKIESMTNSLKKAIVDLERENVDVDDAIRSTISTLTAINEEDNE